MTTADDRRTSGPETAEQPYRAFVTFDAAADALDRVHAQVATWLGERGLDADLTRTGFARQGGAELVVVTHRDHAALQFRMRLTERRPSGTWRTDLTVLAPERGEGWMLLEVADDRRSFVAVPRLAKYLLAAMDVRDGGDLALTDAAHAVSVAQVQELAEAVTDPERNGLIFVAGTDEVGAEFDPFLARVRLWTREVVGQAEVVVLDPHATRAFAEIMENTHGVDPWTIRTYLPDVDPAVESDALRHRFLTTRRLGSAPDQEIVRLLGRIARRHAATRPVPASVERVRRTLARIENAELIEAVTRAPERPAVPAQARPVTDEAPPVAPVATEASRYLAEIEMVKTVLGLDELDEATLRDIASRSTRAVEADALDRVTTQLRDQQELIEDLRTNLESTQAALEEEELQHALTDEERTKLDDEIRFLRKKFKDARDYAVALAPTPDSDITHFPASYLELVERLDTLADSGVVFTGDLKICRELDAYDSLGKSTRTAWEALLVLCDYLRARKTGDWSLGVADYLKSTPAGYRGMAPRKHVPVESNATMQQYGAERVFPVPPECSPGRSATMQAHFRLGHIGMVTPRLYYLDDVDNTGRIYVGYIGRHLTNTQTN